MHSIAKQSLLAASLFAALCSTASAWTTTPTTTTLVNESNVSVPAAVFRPDGLGPFPAVVMMHGCSGLYSNSVPANGIASLYREWGDRLVAAGYIAIAIDSFSGRGAAQNQCGNGTAGTNEVTERPQDARAALNYLATRGDVFTNRIGLLGWSNGGTATLASVEQSNLTSVRFSAAVALYPGCGMMNAFGGISRSTYKPYAPLSILHGTSDPLYTNGYCATRVARAELLGASVATDNAMTMTAFSGAQHSFDMATAVGVTAGTLTMGNADVTAKQAADVLAMAHLDTYLMP